MMADDFDSEVALEEPTENVPRLARVEYINLCWCDGKYNWSSARTIEGREYGISPEFTKKVFDEIQPIITKMIQDEINGV